MVTNKQALIETWFQRVWSEENPDAIDELFAPDGKAIGLGAQTMVGPEDFKAFHHALCTLLTNFSITVDKSIQEGNWISALCTLRGTARTDGTSVTMTGSVLVRYQDDILMEGYNHWDFMGLWGQLGFLPKDAMEKGLQGKLVA